MKTFYDILNVSEDATFDEIYNAYLNQKTKYSKFLNDLNKSKKAEEILQKIEVAYKILGNNQSKEDYDKKLSIMKANELMNNLQKNTNFYNEEMKQKEEEQKAIEEKNRLEELEKKQKEKMDFIQNEINKQIEEQKNQFKLEQKQKKKAEKEKIKAINKYLNSMGYFGKEPFIKKVLRTIFAIIVVFGITFWILKIPIVKNTILNNEVIQMILEVI